MKKPHKLILKLALSCFTLGLLAFIPRDEDPLSKLVTNLQRWTDSIPQEKVYLHMDKPYYALGDTIWFKGYLTIGSRHQLSALSGAIYVELINQNDSLIQQLKLPVTSGMVIGDFILKDNYQQGNYRLRAYTQWMRNAGEDYFYDHTFLVGDIAGGNIIAKADFAYKTDKGKTRLQAVLNYTNNAGSVLGKQNIRYEIKRKNKAIWQQNSTTDASGNLAINIPDDVRQNPAGAYIRTYLKDGKNTIIREFPIKAALSQSDVQFFPESGNLVNGLSSHVAFKAVGIDGLGINIKGTITDNNSNQLAQIETLHAGMGSFLLKPEAGKTYSANITFDDGSTKTILLPKAADQGYVLSVYQPNNDSILVRVQASAPLLQSTVNIIAHTNGQVVLSSPVKVEKPITSIWLDKKSFPTGIAQFTLFDSSGEPLNERIAFIRSNDRLSLDLKTAKTTYGSKEHVLVELNAKDSKGQPTFGNFSVSVIDESKVPFDENKESTIFSNLLLTSDLKGYVEQPNYYFNNENQKVDKAMDNLMLTQGYRRFTRKELNNTVTTKPKFAVEGLGVSISGTVTTLSHHILPNAKVELISLRAKVAKSTTTDANGRFSFDGIFMTDSIKFTVQARMGTSDHAILTLDTLPKIKINPNINLPDVSTNIAGSLKAFLNNAKNDDDIYEKMGLLDKVHRLREVNIRAKKLSVPAGDITPQGMFKINEQSADQVINVDVDEASHYISLAQYLQARLQGIRIGSGPDGSTLELLQGNSTYRSSFRNADNPIALYIDGRKLNPQQSSEALDLSYAPEDIAKIEVVRSNQAMVNFLGGPGVLILTRLGSSRRIYNPSIANISPKGFNRVREFYLPRYDRRGVDLNQPDLRTTIYWNPYLKTDTSGNCSFNFYNADGPGTYKVVVEGINAAGELGRLVYRYTVGAGQAAANLNYTLPAADKNLAKITAPLDSFNQRLPVEKVYLHTDKPYYNIGDTLWFKSYVLDGVNLAASHRSGILYVELDDDSSNVVRRVSIPIKDGIGRGQIALKPVMFKEGGYTLRAYTNWMQNFDGDYVFTQHFYLGIPSTKSWLVNSVAKIQNVGNKDLLQANLKLTRADDPSRAVAYQKVEVKVYDEWHYLSKQEMQTGSDGSLNISQELGRKSDGRRIRVQITSLNKDEGYMITQVPLIINRNQNIDVQFLPESGNLVAGIKSVVGFKAIAEDGRGTAVTGGIFDSQNNQVASFMPLHKGMGAFEFTPKAGEHYKAQISEPVAKAFELPKIQPAGTVMHVDNPEQGDSLKIELFGTGSLSADSACYLIGMARGVIYYSQKVDLNNSTFSVAKNQFPTGITRFTFFKGRTPLNERAVFINNNDALHISIKPNKNSYLKRDSVGLEIEVKDKSGMPVQGSFSLAVTDDSQVKPDSLGNNGMAASLLLKSELKGEIENPGYYLTHKDKQAWQALDNLMLTQGWTGYDWRDVFAPAKPVKFKAEQPYVISGRASNVSNKPLANSTVRVTSLRPVFSDETTTDARGLFEFKNLPHIDSGAYLLQAINVKGKVKSFGEVSVERFQSVIKPEAAKILATPWYVNTDTVELNYVKRKAAMGKDDYELTGRVLKEVKINSTKIIPNSRNVFGPGGSDLVFDKKDIKESGAVNLYELLAQKLPGFKVMGFRWVSIRGADQPIPVLSFNGYSIDLRIDGWPLPLDLDVTPPPIVPEFVANSIKDVWAVPTGGPSLNNHTGKGENASPKARSKGIDVDPASQAGSGFHKGDSGGRANVNYSMQSDLVIDALSQIKIEGLLGLEVSYSRRNTNRAGFKDFDWAHVELTTSSGAGWYRRAPAATTKYQPIPLAGSKLFYSPKYNVESSVKVPDYRSTIFWEPDVATDRNGKAHVSFYTSDIKGKYTLKIAGMADQGGLGDATFKINDVNAADDAKPVQNNPSKKAAVKVPAVIDGIKRITDPLDSLNKRMPAEKVYLQTDKPYYNIGDTLWFKSYLVNGLDLKPSTISGLLYVELDDDSLVAARRVVIKVKDGIGWGQMALPKKIFHEGAYTLRAYTNWMQNFGLDYFFTKRLYLGEVKRSTWLINTEANITNVNNKDRLNINLKLSKPDNLQAPVAMKQVEVTLFELKKEIYNFQNWLYKEKLQTGVDGSLKLSVDLTKKLNGNRLRMQIKSLDKEDNEKTVQAPVIISRDQNIDLQFLPEGGNLVAGLKSVVGFKALGEDGSSVAASGGIYTAAGKQVASFITAHNGMGSFEFTPQANEIYVAKTTTPVNKTYKFPAVKASGTVMHIDNPEKSNNLTVTLNGLNSLGIDAPSYLIGCAKGLIYYSQQVKENQTQFIISKVPFPSGIVHFILFKDTLPVNERMTFIDHKDQFNISVKTNKPIYDKHDSVGVDIEVKDKSGFPVQGSFSLAVTDDSIVPPDTLSNSGIVAGLLLNAELKGRVESPGYYINRKDNAAWQALDNLLLTQGWVGYDWKDIFEPAKPPQFIAEKKLVVKGRVTNLRNKPVAQAPVILSSAKPRFLITAITDADGNYEFENLPTIDSGAFFIQANNARGKPMISADLGLIKFNEPSIPQTQNDPILPWFVNSNVRQLRAAKLIASKDQEDIKTSGVLLQQVNIKQHKIIKGSWYKGGTNLTLDEEDIKASTMTNLYDVLKLKVPGFRIIKDWKYRHGAITMKIGDEDFIEPGDLIIDASPSSKVLKFDNSHDDRALENYIDALREFKVAQLTGIQVILSRSFPLPYRPYYYAEIFVTTKSGLGSFYSRNKPGIATYRPLPILHPRQFYSPKYNTIVSDTKPDYRPTLFWEPNINTDANGKAKVSFYTSDIKGKYTIKIAGMDDQGGLGDGTFKINDINRAIETKATQNSPAKKAAVKVPAVDGIKSTSNRK